MSGLVALLAVTVAIAGEPRLSTTSNHPALELETLEVSSPSVASLNHAVFATFVASGPVPEGVDTKTWFILYLRCSWDSRGACHETAGFVRVWRGRFQAYLGRLESAHLVMAPDDEGVRASGRVIFELGEARDSDEALRVVFSLDDVGFVENKDAMADIAHPAVVSLFPTMADWAKEIGVVSPDDPSAFE